MIVGSGAARPAKRLLEIDSNVELPDLMKL